MNCLTVDLGNSRCKLRVWDLGTESPRPSAAVDFESSSGLGSRVSAWIAAGPLLEAAALCSVASAPIEAEVCACLRSAISSWLDLSPEPGLAIECREPERVGRDRLFAARAALDLAGGSAIVVDAGTALTVDAVRADRTFLGGSIAPGPELLARVLAEGTARLPLVEPRPGAAALGRDTHTALLSGIAVGFRGAARELAARVAEEAGLQGSPVVLTGGARGFLLSPTAFGASRTIEEPDLVHLGLLAVARAALSPARGAGSTGAAWSSKSGS